MRIIDPFVRNMELKLLTDKRTNGLVWKLVTLPKSLFIYYHVNNSIRYKQSSQSHVIYINQTADYILDKIIDHHNKCNNKLVEYIFDKIICIYQFFNRKHQCVSKNIQSIHRSVRLSHHQLFHDHYHKSIKLSINPSIHLSIYQSINRYFNKLSVPSIQPFTHRDNFSQSKSCWKTLYLQCIKAAGHVVVREAGHHAVVLHPDVVERLAVALS